MKIAQLENLQGSFIFASPLITDITFAKSIIILNKIDDVSYGFLINRELTAFEKKELNLNLEGTVFENNPIFFGGPTDTNHIFLLHSGNVKYKNSCKLINDIYISNFNDVLSCNDKKIPEFYKIISGYCNWNVGQLESEIKQGYWLIKNFEHDILFKEEKNKWLTCYKQMEINPLLYSLSYGIS